CLAVVGTCLIILSQFGAPCDLYSFPTRRSSDLYEVALQSRGQVLQVALRCRELRLRAGSQEVRNQDRRQDRDDRNDDQELNQREAPLISKPASKELKHGPISLLHIINETRTPLGGAGFSYYILPATTPS